MFLIRGVDEEIDIVTNTNELLPPGFENDDSEGEIDVVEELHVDNSILIFENELSNNEASDFNNPSFLRPPPGPPDAEFDLEPNAGEEISVVMNDNDELECLDSRDEIDVSTNNRDDDYFHFMFEIAYDLPRFYRFYINIHYLLHITVLEIFYDEKGISQNFSSPYTLEQNVIAPNDPDIPHTKDAEGPPELINTKETHEQNVLDEQTITQSTEGPLGKNTKVSMFIIESLVPDVPRSHISNQVSKSSYPVPHNRWLKDQHMKLVNIIGDPGEGTLTRIMAAKLIAVSASECLFTDFLFEIEPKKVSKELKHLGWVDSMQEELNRPLWTETSSQVMDEKGISIFQEQYTRSLLKKYEISNSSSVKTPMVLPNNLGPNLAGKPVNETSYKGMIGSLMYLTATRPDIQFFIVLCTRYHSNPKESHLIAVKRILSKPYEEISSQVPEGSGNHNSTVSTLSPSAEQMETLTVESLICV
nr:uncharacterized mitochondrial protein AtMg00810-like [Tanacetum cinerariifolium]